jgi:hypothetical protein
MIRPQIRRPSRVGQPLRRRQRPAPSEPERRPSRQSRPQRDQRGACPRHPQPARRAPATGVGAHRPRWAVAQTEEPRDWPLAGSGTRAQAIQRARGSALEERLRVALGPASASSRASRRQDNRPFLQRRTRRLAPALSGRGMIAARTTASSTSCRRARPHRRAHRPLDDGSAPSARGRRVVDEGGLRPPGGGCAYLAGAHYADDRAGRPLLARLDPVVSVREAATRRAHRSSEGSGASGVRPSKRCETIR